jgi:hypothetical protein
VRFGQMPRWRAEQEALAEQERVDERLDQASR